jgi:hypothetical protein
VLCIDHSRAAQIAYGNILAASVSFEGRVYSSRVYTCSISSLALSTADPSCYEKQSESCSGRCLKSMMICRHLHISDSGTRLLLHYNLPVYTPKSYLLSHPPSPFSQPVSRHRFPILQNGLPLRKRQGLALLRLQRHHTRTWHRSHLDRSHVRGNEIRKTSPCRGNQAPTLSRSPQGGGPRRAAEVRCTSLLEKGPRGTRLCGAAYEGRCGLATD